MTVPKVGPWMWHVPHEVLCEPLTEPLANRIAYIKANKPKNEIETRLRWLTPVRGKVPTALDKAVAAYDKAGAAYVKAQAAHDKAWAAALPALERLHAKEHGSECPWDGEQLVFPR